MWGFVSMGKTVCDSERDGSPNSVRKTDFWDKYEVAIYVVSSNALDAVYWECLEHFSKYRHNKKQSGSGYVLKVGLG